MIAVTCAFVSGSSNASVALSTPPNPAAIDVKLTLDEWRATFAVNLTATSTTTLANYTRGPL